MDNAGYILQAVSVGGFIASFLLNTCRVLKGIELLKECLIVLENTKVSREEETFKPLFETIPLLIIEAYRSINDYKRATEYARKLLVENSGSDRLVEASAHERLGLLSYSLSKYVIAKEHFEQALEIWKEYGARTGEASSYEHLGRVFLALGQFVKAKECFEKALAIRKEIGDKREEAFIYKELGWLFKRSGEYIKSKEYHKKALVIINDVGGGLRGSASIYESFGTLLRCLGEYDEAKECHEKALAIRKEFGDRKQEASSYGNLATVFQSVGEYVKAKEYLEKALAISREFGDKDAEAAHYTNLGGVFRCLGEYDKAKEYLEEALAIKQQIGDRCGEAGCYGHLGNVFQYLREYEMAIEYHKKALAIAKEIGQRDGEASSYGNLGAVFQGIGNYVEAKVNHAKALEIRKEIGDKEGQAADYANLGRIFSSLCEYDKAEECLKEGVAISESIGDIEKHALLLSRFAWLKYSEGKIQQAFSYLLPSIQKCEDLRSFLGDNDQYKISFSDDHVFPYWVLGELLCVAGKHDEALYVSELGRARALADLMSAQYLVETQITANPKSWVGIETIIKKQSNCTFLYISYSSDKIFFWVLNSKGLMNFRRAKVQQTTCHKRLVRNFDDVMAKSFRGFGASRGEECEDRTLNDIQPKLKSVEENRGDEEHQEPDLNLLLCYKMIIAPVADLLEESEIIIVPERSLYKVPFPALTDESGKYLSETFRIRVIPSLTTLKLIQDSPADYHSQTGALIVGNPDVGLVRYRGSKKHISRLPCAGKEAEMIGRLLAVQPLLGEQATKQAVLERLNSVSLIHFAAHGDSDTGEIALAPKRPTAKKIPQEKDYLLTMSDISNVKLRAKLVVLSCCHSGRGQIRAEGVIGIARAFLGSGARSVLVALWALEDSATEAFMSRFYEHLVHGKSASESLHQAMKWMRGNGYSQVRQWAPFVLIGDNVALNFGK